jgi:hypothetical protein
LEDFFLCAAKVSPSAMTYWPSAMTVFVEALNAGVPHKKEREKGEI